MIDRIFEGVPQDGRLKMLVDNIVEFFHLDIA